MHHTVLQMSGKKGKVKVEIEPVRNGNNGISNICNQAGIECFAIYLNVRSPLILESHLSNLVQIGAVVERLTCK